MRDTTALEKLIPSLINAALAITLSLSALYFFGPYLVWKVSVILIFYVIQIADTHRHAEFRCFGMRVFGTHWAKKYSRRQRNLYSILYTISFSTLFFHVFFPFDLFLVNMFVFQLPSVLLTGTTFHGLLAGGMRTKKRATAAH